MVDCTVPMECIIQQPSKQLSFVNSFQRWIMVWLSNFSKRIQRLSIPVTFTLFGRCPYWKFFYVSFLLFFFIPFVSFDILLSYPFHSLNQILASFAKLQDERKQSLLVRNQTNAIFPHPFQYLKRILTLDLSLLYLI